MNPAQIVLIEDNPADVLLVELALKENGVSSQLTRFASGEEALRVLCEPGGAEGLVPDAILLDLNTPRSDGFQVLIKLKQFPRFTNVPIAILTSSRATSDKHRSRLQGARYIEKPAQLEEFLATVGQAVKEMLSAPRKPLPAI
jgi:CheY-like chemotaxis protein